MNEQSQSEKDIEEKILHLLAIYPVISPTMLQAALGPSTRPALWRPVMQQMIDNKQIIESSQSLETPTSRYNTYAKLSLPGVIVSYAGKA